MVIRGSDFGPPLPLGAPAPPLDSGVGSNSSDADADDVAVVHPSAAQSIEMNGTRPFLREVRYGPTGVEYLADRCIVLSHSMAECLTVPSVGSELRWTMRVEGRTSELSVVTSATSPAGLVSASRLQGDTIGDGRDTIELFATDMASEDPEAEVVLVWGQGTPQEQVLQATTPAFVMYPAGSPERIFEQGGEGTIPSGPVGSSNGSVEGNATDPTSPSDGGPEPLGAPSDEAVALGMWNRERDLEAVRFTVP